ncbi:anti-sigma regulatory factor (Ser/Thr protein kinase) [Kineococcus rhizosphaerae]|uniref:Anti-sigma regulatory factor (Ser/Thr protein kinase) n=2 Tax=Kineococcus rhizosphaerae TaxID=559628 RepID=A0A2T0R2E0_9ACTN|nr:anti-sigma regulatory factor (Ser/Thr protein kinase) [Kineococcus rhizosphaerae]
MPVADLDLPVDLSAARRAREFVRARWCPDHGGDALEGVLLVVSELIVNAVEHGAPPVRARVDCRSDVLRLEVSDGSPAFPQHLSPGPQAESGRGVGLVATICSDWGVRRDGAGKTVWCDVPA